MKLSKRVALFCLASSFLLAGFSLQVFAAPPVMSVTGSVDANVTNNVKVTNPDGGALDVKITGTDRPLDVRIQSRVSSYVLSLNANATIGSTGVDTVTVPFDSYLAGMNVYTDGANSASCQIHVYLDRAFPEGSNTNLIASAGFSSVPNSQYIPIPNIFIVESNTLFINVLTNSNIPGGEYCSGRVTLYLLPDDK